MKLTIFKKTAAENIAACRVHGLSFWGGSPIDGCVVAVDAESQTFWRVKINRAGRRSEAVRIDNAGAIARVEGSQSGIDFRKSKAWSLAGSPSILDELVTL